MKKISYFFIVLILTASVGCEKQTEVTAMPEDFAPCEFLEVKPGLYSLIFTDFDAHLNVITKNGGQGGGYTWEALVKAAVELKSIEVPGIEYDPESDMFAAYGSNKESLIKIASLIKEMTEDPDTLKKAITKAKSGGYFE
jgi:hypothetical protein